MSILNKIRGALETHLNGMSGVPTTFYSNVYYDPDPNTTFLKVTFVPTTKGPVTKGLNPWVKYEGFFSILVCTPEGNGTGDSLELADTILDRFASTTDISFDGIIVTISSSRIAPDYFSAPFNCQPIMIDWYIHHTN